ncbi:MAG: penicillin-binding protein activator LpoB [Alphaproteobacteria bacterium]|nr:penicillin-binding protein activator LpoB [Alphaproteobacteria bacterium]
MKKILPMTICLALCACAEPRVVDLNDSREVDRMQNVMELEYRDWTNTAEKMTKSMIDSGVLNQTPKPIVAISDIKNDTAQRFDPDILTKKIRTTLMKSKAVQFTTNFTGEDVTSTQIRINLRNNDEYDKSTIPNKGTLIAPNMSLSGKMLQRNLELESGWFSSTDTRVEYYLQLTLTDLKTGLSIWEDEQPIIKEGDHAPTW